jgi:hypothetical protein
MGSRQTRFLEAPGTWRTEEEGMTRYVRITLGSILVVLGLVGLALPILQGVLFIALGVLVLGKEIPLFARIAERFRSRFPQASRAAERARKRLSEWWRRLRPWNG